MDNASQQPTNVSGKEVPGNTMGNQSAVGGGDMLDKGVNYVERKAGHEQSRGTTEKISDGLRKGFQKVTGKDVPIKDQN